MAGADLRFGVHLFGRRIRRVPTNEEEGNDMDEQTFQEKFTELLQRIGELPPEQRACMEQLADATQRRRDRISHSVTELQESLDFLRLSVKYLVFDLEATRRENAYLRQLLDQATRERRRSRDDGDEHERGHDGH